MLQQVESCGSMHPSWHVIHCPRKLGGQVRWEGPQNGNGAAYEEQDPDVCVLGWGLASGTDPHGAHGGGHLRCTMSKVPPRFQSVLESLLSVLVLSWLTASANVSLIVPCMCFCRRGKRPALLRRAWRTGLLVFVV